VKIRGKIWKYGDDVDTDVIIPARYLVTSDPDELGPHCLEELDPDFTKKMSEGDFIAAGKNFGCGSSREHAPIAIRGSGVACVIAKTFARIFYRNALNTGLPIFECPEVVEESETGHELEVDTEAGTLTNLTTGKAYQIPSLPPFVQEIIDSGGLMSYVANKKGLSGGGR
jgi:3-isopropylmalate/(R)-2-methylmalate dehydratase small subunit